MSTHVIETVTNRWAACLIDFNVLVARFAHRSWFPPTVDELFGCHGVGGGLGELKSSEWLLEELDLWRQMDWGMEERQKRLWLLDLKDLERLSYDVSLAMHRDWLARVIDGARVRELHSKIDPLAWRFVVEKVPADGVRHRSAVVDFERALAGEIAERLRRDGVSTLMSLLQPTWRPVCLRARLRFDRMAAFEATGLTTSHCDQVLELICNHVIPQRLPQWAWLF